MTPPCVRGFLAWLANQEGVYELSINKLTSLEA